MSHRKLQQEMDKVFKKINEGLEIFNDIYERHDSCNNNQSQKEKLESDLKREIKKLQRLREQIKSWQSSNEVKDKDSLLDYRRSVEVAMEKYKIVEKASKEKAYSNISLKKSDTLDPEEKERQEVSTYLLNSIDELDRQFEALQIEVDKLQLLNKKKKTYSAANDEKIRDLKSLQSRFRWHQQQIELALRLLANEELEVQKVNNIRDDLNYFIEANQDADFIEDETIYDNLDLQSNEAIAHEVAKYFASQKLVDDADDDSSINNESVPSTPSSKKKADDSTLSSDEAAKKSKKELRKLEREAKKAAKLAAKSAHASAAALGATPVINTTPILPPQERLSPSPAPSVTNNKPSEPSTEKNPDIVHTHIHQGLNGVTSSTILKPAPIPSKPVGESKWSTIAAASHNQSIELVKSDSTTSTPISANAMLVNNAKEKSTSPLISPSPIENNQHHTSSLESLIGNNNASSAQTAAAVLAAGAAAVNQNNQQYHNKQSGFSNDQLLVTASQTKNEVDQDKRNYIDSTAHKNDDDYVELTCNSSIFNSDSETEYETDYEDERELLQQSQLETDSTNKSRQTPELNYLNDFHSLILPNGIKEYIMSYEINNDNPKRSKIKRSVELCNIDRLNDIPAGVNPPNPLDAFRSTQQWDLIRCNLKDLESLSLNDVLGNFKNLEMFSLFYNYYFAITPLEKKISFELLIQKNWKISKDETMWFLRQNVIKFQNENFEISDFKIFKLDDWSVIDKINFRLDYSQLKYIDNEIKQNLQSHNSTNNSVTIDSDALTHGQQLLQQLKQTRDEPSI
ncbi:hypothetical protein KAFR_0C02470 [Kazachstania africana CBS 2517]|uniref:General negative regulator of transcription subunit n=1 Tax=Kazachstania africana (strain ATCC 22294 / BCRC 22015 / CBS 2517 / CECT 1963 / NBRC 1671 / NRRL Y-8276) TaxID=1071382 RepID=H2AS90_KAZAF|nr:hypothetical protein KAFR_0C02470 [Kazachstania africana CBS 2517]CCF57240.1 hypothetical protein KAFR_0C02470 [Kazachstania africana CBS 2517]